MRMRRALTACLALLLAACDGRFAFDEGPRVTTPAPVLLPDAAPAPPASLRDGAPPDAVIIPPDAALDGAPDLTPPRDLGSPEVTADSAPDLRPDSGPPTPIACGSGVSGCSCSGTQCSCGNKQDCTFTGMGCDRVGGSCTMLCHLQNRCTGQCLHSCHLECYNNSNCEFTMGDAAEAEIEGTAAVGILTVGPGSQVKCENGASCSITCTGSCSLECENARCNLRCGADGTPRQADSGGRCN
jgi:hypothetical protein